MLEKKITYHGRGKDKVEIEEIVPSIDNFRIIFEHDPNFSGIRYNLMRGYAERIVNGKRIPWDNIRDSAASRMYIEKVYGLYQKAKSEDAFNVVAGSRSYHPVQQLMDRLVADGAQHCTTFLIRIMGAEDTAYNREVSRLLFSGGINRTYSPGCKFDCVPVLIGPQGAGKSTICQLLALSPDFYSSAKTISGQRGLEAIQGKFIVELEELLAVLANEKAGTMIEDSAKAFLSSSSDFYRKPYDPRPTDNPRSCIFVGTTNREEFLTDKTGNRRWFPVRCSVDGSSIFNHLDEIKKEITLCWAEMRDAYKAGDPLASPTPRMELLTEIKKQQSIVEIQDYRIGLIEDFVKDLDRVCLIQLWREVFYPDSMTVPQMTRRDSCDLAEILTHSLGWLRGNVESFGIYGRQKAYRKQLQGEYSANTIPDEPPF